MYMKILTNQNVWDYLTGTLVPAIKPNYTAFENQIGYPYISDQTSIIVSHAIIRQLRTRNCKT